ncbi:MAG: UDP-N-acetylmuramoyl-tripeptide--D-alanyl-D-alanine ligase [Candidatus Moraniibacteriota bacterium]
MKSRKILFLENVLRWMAMLVLKQRKPTVVAITGSVGKTSAKDAIYSVLSAKFSVRENQKNYNNEIGIPLTIIGAESGGRNVFKWLWVFLRWLLALILPGYPKILVLELGIDRPGDMAHFMSFIHPKVSVVTNVSASHLEFFSTVERIAKEKSVLVRALADSDFAILNGDDELVFQMGKNTKASVLSFGYSQEAAINASNLNYNYQAGAPDGISFKLNYQGKNIPIRLKNILAGHYVYAALAAIATGIIFKMNLVEIAQAIEKLQSPTGRMNLVPGVNGGYIIDDTYNASPISTLAALETLSQLQGQRKIAVLGDMLELGDQSQKGHLEVIKKAFELNVNPLFIIGERMTQAAKKYFAEQLLIEKIRVFNSHQEIILALQKIIKKRDFVLVKGSQGMRMEKIVEGILANPEDGEKLLCRQTSQWKEKPYMKP